MAKDLTSSQRERQNILNNRYALSVAQEKLALGGVELGGELLFTKLQVMALFEVSDSTVERYIAVHSAELGGNGYQILKGSKLREFKKIADVSFIGEGNKAPVLGVFSFRAVLNFGMLLTDSEPARLLRSRLLDIVLDVVAERVGGHTRYINQRDEEYLPIAFQEESYRKVFTDALDKYVEGNHWKYSRFTNLIYQAVFRENAKEYKKVLSLTEKDQLRETLYAEVLNLIASFESGLAHELEKASDVKGAKLTQKEAASLFTDFEQHPLFKPLIQDARAKMASRDLCFREALHEKLESYVREVPEADFDRFLGEKSRSLEERLSDPETIAVFKRLKDR